MRAHSYTLSEKSKKYHALDSFVYEYQNAGGMRDNLKIEINYMLRCHIFDVSRRMVKLPWLNQELTVLCVDPIEIFASKIVALMNRAAPRDLYDFHNMIHFGLKGSWNCYERAWYIIVPSARMRLQHHFLLILSAQSRRTVSKPNCCQCCETALSSM